MTEEEKKKIKLLHKLYTPELFDKEIRKMFDAEEAEKILRDFSADSHADETKASEAEEDGMFAPLTKYIPAAGEQIHGKFLGIGCVAYDKPVTGFMDAVSKFEEQHPEMALWDYGGILTRAGIGFDSGQMEKADVSNMDGETAVALIFAAVSAEKFSDGALEEFWNSGSIKKWLERLKEIDSAE